MSRFQRAKRSNTKLRLANAGLSGSGKTMSSIRIARGIGGRIAVIDTEHGSSEKYSDIGEFDVLRLTDHHPERFIEAIREAESEGYDIIVIDSLSAEWAGNGGCLELVDRAAKRQQGNSFGAWRDVTPLHMAVLAAIAGSRCHIIVTIRCKTEHVQEKDDRGKSIVRKIGMQPIQREGIEYEFDIWADMTLDHDWIISKTRFSALDGAIIARPGEAVGERIRELLYSEPEASPASESPEAGSTASASTAPPSSADMEEQRADAFRQSLENEPIPTSTGPGADEPKIGDGAVSTLKRSLKGAQWGVQSMERLLVEYGVTRVEDIPVSRYNDLLKDVQSPAKLAEIKRALGAEHVGAK